MHNLTTTTAAGRLHLRPAPRKRKGFALLTVMWVVLVAAMIVLGMQKAGRSNLAMATHELESVRAHWLARAGVEKAMAVLDEDTDGSDGSTDYWHSNEEAFKEARLLGGSYSVTAPPDASDDLTTPRYGLLDHSALLHLNTADAAALKALEFLDVRQIAAILDWRDEDNEVSPGGAEAMYYRRLPLGYETRNGPLLTVREAALVHGMTPAALHAEDANANGVLDGNENDLRESAPADNGDGQLDRGLVGLTTVWAYEKNEDAFGQPRVNVNATDKETLMSRLNLTEALAEAIAGGEGTPTKRPGTAAPGGVRPAKSGSGKKKYGSLIDLLKVKVKANRSAEDAEGAVREITLTWLARHIDEMTVSGDERLPGRINVNTAPYEVLMTLPNMTPVTAEAILRRRSGGELPFESAGELLTSETVTNEQFKAIAQRVCVRSSVFEIRSTGVTTFGVRQTIVAVVDRGADPMKILYWYQSE